MNGIQFNPFNREARALSLQKSNLESELYAKIMDGSIITGSPEYWQYSDLIEQLAADIILEDENYRNND